jgi:hypothetical protein
MKNKLVASLITILLLSATSTFAQSPSKKQLERWLARFPEADLNNDGELTAEEAMAFRQRMLGERQPGGRQSGAPRQFEVDPRWQDERFPEEAVCYRSPEEIANIIGQFPSHPRPSDGSFRIVATGHSFMAPGFKTFPLIAQAAGFGEQVLHTHTGGGMTGSARYKWEQENGIFQFEGRPTPKLLAAISNAEWDRMMWGPYFNDRPEYYACWIEFCLKYNPDMKFYLSDGWPQLEQLDSPPASEADFTPEMFERMGKEKKDIYGKLVDTLNAKYPGKVYILPTCDAMVLAAKRYLDGQLPGVEGVHKAVGSKERSLWRDRLGHLGPGFDRLEGYVFYATIYGRSPELVEEEIKFAGDSDFPPAELDSVFRAIAWEAVVNNPRSGVREKNGDGIRDTESAD